MLARKGYNPGMAFSLIKDVMTEARLDGEDCGLEAGPPYP